MKKRAMVMGFVAVAMATAKPLPPQDVAEIRAWHTKLELPPVKDLPFVRVATGVSRVVAGEGERNTYLMAFLLKDHCGKDGQDFEVMTIDRHRLSFTRTKEGVKEADRRGYERTDWTVWLPAYLSAPKDDPDGIANLSSDRFTSIGPSTPATTLVNLAMYCDEVGFRPDAGRILERLSSSWSIEEGEGKPLMERLQHEFGHALIWQAMLACDDPVNPRRELQKNFERIVAECPKSRHVARAKEISDVLKRMIPEDDAHAAERAKVPFGKLSREDQIKDLIFQLRDQDGFQFSQPGSCSIFSFGGAGETPADRLVEFGFDAVPPLIEVLGDDRLTYSVGYHRNFYFSHEVLRVGDAAQQVIEKIGGVNLNQGIEVRMFGEDPKRYGEGGLRKAIQADARRWWEAFSAKGEKRFLIDEVSAGGESAPQLVDKLAEKYPEEVPKALELGLKNAKEEWQHASLVDALGRAGFPGSEEILREVIRENRFGSGTLAAIKALQDRGKGDAIDLAIALLDQDKTWKEGGWMDEMPAEGLLEWLVESPVEKGLRAILQLIDKLPVGLRVDVATGFFGIRHEENKVDEATLAAVEELLVKLTGDKRRRTGMSGSIGDFSYSDPRVCDLAMEALRRGWQGRYEFDYQGSLKSRDRQCVIAANVWRKSRGMELLPVPEAAVRTLSDEEFAPLAKRFAAMATPADETAFSYAMMSAGIGALPGLLELEKSAKGKKKEVAASVRRMLSNRVERIEISPQGLDYEPIRKWAEAMKGASLDGAAVVRLLSSFFQKASVNGEKVRGIEFEASRDGDLGGVGIRITLTPKERPDDELDQWDGSENVTLAGESVHTAGYGGGLSKDDPKESEELKAGVDKAVSADATAPYEIRWKLVGWWQDEEEEE